MGPPWGAFCHITLTSCWYCTGTDAADMESHCPGDTSEVHWHQVTQWQHDVSRDHRSARCSSINFISWWCSSSQMNDVRTWPQADTLNVTMMSVFFNCLQLTPSWRVLFPVATRGMSIHPSKWSDLVLVKNQMFKSVPSIVLFHCCAVCSHRVDYQLQSLIQLHGEA